MKFLSILLATIPSAFCCAQTLVYTPKIIYTSHTLADNDLKGKVKSADFFSGESMSTDETELLKNSAYFFNENGLLTKFVSYASETESPESVSFESIYTYDAKGNLTLVEDLMGETKAQTSYTYSSDGRLKEYKYISNDESMPESRITYDYNSKTMKTAVAMYTGDELNSKAETSQDAKGQITKIVSYTCDGKDCKNEDMSITYTYDAQGNLTSEKSAGSSVYESKYYYNSKNQIIKKESKFEGNEAAISSEQIEYDAKGRVAKILSFVGGTEEPASTTSYEYDEQGNWTKMISTYNSESSYVSVRKISYY